MMNALKVFTLIFLISPLGHSAEQVLTCGPVMAMSENDELCGPSNRLATPFCKPKINNGAVMAPQFEMWLKAGDELPDLSVLTDESGQQPGVVTKVPMSVELTDFKMLGERLTFTLNLWPAGGEVTNNALYFAALQRQGPTADGGLLYLGLLAGKLPTGKESYVLYGCFYE